MDTYKDKKQSRKSDYINILSLVGIQASNALFPLVVFPYLLKVLGAEDFSVFVSIEAIMFLILTFSLYSFEIIGVKKVSHANAIGLAVYDLYWEILFVRLLILTSMGVMLTAICYFFFKEYMVLFALWLLFPLGMVLQSNYFRQALEDTRILAVAVLSTRIIGCYLIYLFVNSPSDGLLAALLLNLTFLSSGLFIFFIDLIKGRKYFKFLSIKRFRELIVEGKVIFLSGASVVMFRSSNVLILTIVTRSPDAVSFYAIAEKYVKMLQALAVPLNQYYFTKTSHALRDKYTYPIKVIWKNTKYQVFLVGVASLFFLLTVYIDAYYTEFLLNKEIGNLIILMCPVVFFGVCNYMFGSVGLNLLGYEKYYAKVIFLTGICSMICCAILGYLIASTGAAIAFLFSEVMLFSLIMRLFKNKIV